MFSRRAEYICFTFATIRTWIRMNWRPKYLITILYLGESMTIWSLIIQFLGIENLIKIFIGSHFLPLKIFWIIKLYFEKCRGKYIWKYQWNIWFTNKYKNKNNDTKKIELVMVQLYVIFCFLCLPNNEWNDWSIFIGYIKPFEDIIFIV